MTDNHNRRSDIREHIKEVIEHLQHLLPNQAPIRDFVHHNTLHGFEHLPFQEALASARRITGARGFMPLEKYRDYYHQGRITHDDLLSCVKQAQDLEPDTLLADTPGGPISRGDIIVAVMTIPYQPVSACQLNWQIEENRVLERLRPDLPKAIRHRLLSNAQEGGVTTESSTVRDLWNACLQVLHLEHDATHPEELLDLAPEQAETLLHEMLEVANSKEGTPSTTTQLMQQTASNRLGMLLERLGRDMTMRDLLLVLTGHDLLDDIRPQLIRDLSIFLDQGV
ncbi:MAG: Na-translocating system protein MpsB, partial [Candidatus Thiodiazotropha sp.]